MSKTPKSHDGRQGRHKQCRPIQKRFRRRCRRFGSRRSWGRFCTSPVQKIRSSATFTASALAARRHPKRHAPDAMNKTINPRSTTHRSTIARSATHRSAGVRSREEPHRRVDQQPATIPPPDAIVNATPRGQNVATVTTEDG